MIFFLFSKKKKKIKNKKKMSTNTLKRKYDPKERFNYKKLKTEIDETKFEEWKKERGLSVDAWDEKRNGPLSHRCTEPVLRILFLINYDRPANWNDSKKYYHIALMDGDGGAYSEIHYVRCDQLSGSQFDHMIALSVHNDGDLGMCSRVTCWFDENNGDNGDSALDEDGTNEYGYSHLSEIGLFSEDKYDDEDRVLVLRNCLRRPYIPEVLLNVGFALSYYKSGF